MMITMFFSSPLHYPDDGNNNQKDSCVGDSGSGLMREIEMAGDHFPRYWLSFTKKCLFQSCF